MYFADYDITDIALKFNLPVDTIRYHVYGADEQGTDPLCWSQLKKKLNPASIAIYIKDKVTVLEKTAGVALNLLNKSLLKLQADLETEDKALSVDDMNKLAAIVTNLDKMVRLESGQATSIVENIGLSIDEAKHIMANDPFAQAVEAEYQHSKIDEHTLPWLKND